MTTVEIMQQALSWARVKDLSGCAAEDAIQLARALNAGLQRYFQAVPEAHRRTTISHLIKAPQDITLTATNGSTTVDNVAFAKSQRGCSLKLDGDPDIWNEIVDTAKVLFPYAGTTGDTGGTLYYDAVVVSDFRIERLVTEPTCLETGRRLTGQNRPGYLGHPEFAPALPLNRRRSLGTYPDYYSVQYIGGSEQVDNDGVFQLRLDPIPTLTCRLSFDALLWPLEYGVDDLSTPASLPVSDSLAHTTLLPMIEAALVNTPLYDGPPEKAQTLLMLGNDAEERSRMFNAPYLAPVANKLGTPQGW